MEDDQKGATKEDIQELSALGVKVSPEVEVQKEKDVIVFGVNREAVQLFAMCHPTQWRYSASGQATGMDWCGVDIARMAMGFERTSDLMMKFRQCEIAALSYWAEQAENYRARSKPKIGPNSRR